MKNELEQFANDNNLTLTATLGGNNPNMDKAMFHWQCILSNGKTSFAFPFSCGGAHVQLKKPADRSRMPAGVTANDLTKAKNASVYYDFDIKSYCSRGSGGSAFFLNDLYASLFEPKPPTIDDVLGSLASDARVMDCRNFSEWADDYGYDTDSLKARKIYDACIEIALQLKALLGSDQLEKLQNIEY